MTTDQFVTSLQRERDDAIRDARASATRLISELQDALKALDDAEAGEAYSKRSLNLYGDAHTDAAKDLRSADLLITLGAHAERIEA